MAALLSTIVEFVTRMPPMTVHSTALESGVESSREMSATFASIQHRPPAAEIAMTPYLEPIQRRPPAAEIAMARYLEPMQRRPPAAEMIAMAPYLGPIQRRVPAAATATVPYMGRCMLISATSAFDLAASKSKTVLWTASAFGEEML